MLKLHLAEVGTFFGGNSVDVLSWNCRRAGIVWDSVWPPPVPHCIKWMLEISTNGEHMLCQHIVLACIKGPLLIAYTPRALLLASAATWWMHL